MLFKGLKELLIKAALIKAISNFELYATSDESPINRVNSSKTVLMLGALVKSTLLILVSSEINCEISSSGLTKVE